MFQVRSCLQTNQPVLAFAWPVSKLLRFLLLSTGNVTRHVLGMPKQHLAIPGGHGSVVLFRWKLRIYLNDLNLSITFPHHLSIRRAADAGAEGKRRDCGLCSKSVAESRKFEPLLCYPDCEDTDPPSEVLQRTRDFCSEALRTVSSTCFDVIGQEAMKICQFASCGAFYHGNTVEQVYKYKHKLICGYLQEFAQVCVKHNLPVNWTSLAKCGRLNTMLLIKASAKIPFSRLHVKLSVSRIVALDERPWKRTF